MVSPFDWTDVADLNYENDQLWSAMTDALEFWVTEADIDGYRCDVAGMVPTEFWNKARYELDRIKPVFMLAEAEVPAHHENAFDMSYAWELHHIFNEIAKGEQNADDLEAYFTKQDTTFLTSAYRMAFVTNHDENSWNGTINERMGESGETFAVLSYTLPGMPLIYSGQEVGLNKRLAFFEKDEIDWDYNSPLIEFYTTLNLLKKDNEALWNGEYGGPMNRIQTSASEKVFVFTRVKQENVILVVANLSDENLNVVLMGQDHLGNYVEVFSGEEMTFLENSSIGLGPWEYTVYLKR